MFVNKELLQYILYCNKDKYTTSCCLYTVVKNNALAVLLVHRSIYIVQYAC